MGFIGSLFSNDKGAGFQAQGTNVVEPASKQMADQLWNMSDQGMSQQKEFISALQAQNGIGNQSNVFNQQQALAQQLQQQALGQGPNPAQAALAQSTGQNIANQAALMAGQRGSSANAGLMARQAAQQGGALQQQAVGQGATMQAQQQLAAQQALQQQQGMMGNLATQQVGQQGSAITGLNQMIQGEQQNILNSINAQNNAKISNQSNVNNANSNIAGANAQGQSKMLGGILSGAGAVMGLAGGGRVPGYDGGGQVENDDLKKFQNGLVAHLPAFFDYSKHVTQPSPEEVRAQELERIRAQNRANFGYADGGFVGPSSFAGKFLKGYGSNGVDSGSAPQQQSRSNRDIDMGSGTSDFIAGAGKMLKGKPSDPMAGSQLMSGEGESSLASELAPLAKLAIMANKGGKIDHLAANGGKVPGTAKVKGDSLKNDKVPAMLSPKEIVLPRSVTQHPDAPKKAAEFVAALLAKEGMRRK